MGYKKFYITISLFFLSLFFSIGSSGMDTRKTFTDAKQIRAWATEYAEFSEFKGKKRELCVVIEHPTSGVYTSEVYVFIKVINEYRLIYYRYKYGMMLTSKRDENGINFLSNGKKVLSVSWRDLENLDAEE